MNKVPDLSAFESGLTVVARGARASISEKSK